MPESWVQCVTRVYKQNKTKRGKDADGKFKYKLKHAMKDAKKVYKSTKTTKAFKGKARKSRKAKRGGRRKSVKKGGAEGDEEESKEEESKEEESKEEEESE